jgi:RNA-directed DNA polymerase
VKAFLKKVRGLIEHYKDSSAGQLVVKLNPVIRGWATYHRFGASSQTFNSVDHAIFKKLWWWARRRHPRKSATWVKQKYFTTVGTRNWVFTGEVEDEEGHRKLVHLRRAFDVKIQRHTPHPGRSEPL